MYFCIYVHMHVSLAPNNTFCPMAFHRFFHHDGALPWGECGICGVTVLVCRIIVYKGILRGCV